VDDDEVRCCDLLALTMRQVRKTQQRQIKWLPGCKGLLDDRMTSGVTIQQIGHTDL
jgi:hypothetical protein